MEALEVTKAKQYLHIGICFVRRGTYSSQVWLLITHVESGIV